MEEIPIELYDKAEKHQDQLTDSEKQVLAGRGDLVGRGLAYPESLTPSELNDLLQRSPPDVVRDRIRQATGGALSTTTELWAKAREAREREDWNSLSVDAWLLLGTNFNFEVPSKRTSRWRPRSRYNNIPEYEQLYRLLRSRDGTDGGASCIAILHLSENIQLFYKGRGGRGRTGGEWSGGPVYMYGGPSNPPLVERPGRTAHDVKGRPMWPYECGVLHPITLFGDEMRAKTAPENMGLDKLPEFGAMYKTQYDNLSAQEKARYAAMSEASRIAAWDKYDQEKKERAAVLTKSKPDDS